MWGFVCIVCLVSRDKLTLHLILSGSVPLFFSIHPQVLLGWTSPDFTPLLLPHNFTRFDCWLHLVV